MPEDFPVPPLPPPSISRPNRPDFRKFALNSLLNRETEPIATRAETRRLNSPKDEASLAQRQAIVTVCQAEPRQFCGIQARAKNQRLVLGVSGGAVRLTATRLRLAELLQGRAGFRQQELATQQALLSGGSYRFVGRLGGAVS